VSEPDDSRKNYRNNAVTVVTACWKNLLKNRKTCLNGDDVDAIHDLRVSTRRLRAALDLFGPFCSIDEAPHVRSSIRRLTRGIGELRNLDEAILFFSRLPSGKGTSGDMFAPLLLHLSDKREHELIKVRKLLKKLDATRIGQTIDRLVACLREPDDSGHGDGSPISIPAYFSEYGLRLYGDINRHLPGALQSENVQNRHALRIAVKHWRYFLEIAARIFERDYEKTLELLKDYQQLLGNLNDLRVFGTLTGEVSLAPAASAKLGTLFGRLTADHLGKLAVMLEKHPIRYEFLM
jgi:CHAD domain-containing protein